MSEARVSLFLKKSCATRVGNDSLHCQTENHTGTGTVQSEDSILLYELTEGYLNLPLPRIKIDHTRYYL